MTLKELAPCLLQDTQLLIVGLDYLDRDQTVYFSDSRGLLDIVLEYGQVGFKNFGDMTVLTIEAMTEKFLRITINDAVVTLNRKVTK